MLSRILFPTLFLLLASNADAKAAQKLNTRLDGYLQTLAQEGFTGVVLVAQDGEIVFENAYGMAHREKKTPVTTDMVFTTGSITKQFTAAAILQLETGKRLSVDAPITKYFEGVPADKQGITLHHLLTHSAGFPGGIGRDPEPIGRDDYVRKAFKTKLDFAPGERYEYSNVGYSLLAAIIEKVTGSSYEQYLRDNLFLPAGMKETGYVLTDWPDERLAHGYRDDKYWGTVPDRVFSDNGPGWNLVGNGGIHSTARDMYRWHQALLGDAILSAAAKEKMYTRHVDEGGGSWYGYGWVILPTSRGTRLITHNGGNMVFFADFLRFLDDDIVIYLASSAGGRQREDAAYVLARMIIDPSYKPKIGNGD